MSGPHWDPAQYERFADERAQPFFDLLSRARPAGRQRVVDLGCGTGALTAWLTDRYPQARVTGVDRSAEMLAAAALRAVPGRLEFVQHDLRHYDPGGPVDLLVSNAALQWVPGHVELLGRLAGLLAPGGVLALQVPANFTEPAHRLLYQLADAPRWSAALGPVLEARPQVAGPAVYLEALLGAGLAPIVWETTYLQLLGGPDAVLEWMKGTALRPVLEALGPDAGRFVAEYGGALAAAYPQGAHGTVLPYRRIFAVGQAGDD